MAYSVAQNTSFLTAASVLQKIISFFYFTLIARIIGVENTGQYFFAVSFTTIFTVVADLGLSTVLTREIAREPSKTTHYVNTIFTAKLLFGVMAYALVVLGARALGYSVETRQLIYLSGVTMFFDSITSTFNSVLRARKNLIFEAVNIIGSQVLTLGIGSFALYYGWPLIWLIAAFTIPSFFSCVYLWIAAQAAYHIRIIPRWDTEVIKPFLAMAMPFAAAAIIGRLYSQSDSLLMSKLLTERELGWWSVPYKITFAFQFIPIALSTSVYPVFSSLHVAEPAAIGPLFEKSWRYLFLIIFPLVFGIAAIAEPVILEVYGPNYAPSILTLRLLLISLIFGYLSLITGALLNATNHQKAQTLLMASALVSSVILNLLLLRRIGIVSASLATIVGNGVLCLGGYYYAKRYIPIDYRQVWKYVWQSLVPAAIMGGIVYMLVQKIHFLAAVSLGVGIYGLLLFATGGINKNLIRKGYNKMFGRSVTSL